MQASSSTNLRSTQLFFGCQRTVEMDSWASCHVLWWLNWFALDSIILQFPSFCRMLLCLSVADILHLVSSLLSFSLPTLSQSFLTNAYPLTLPYTLPLAQVMISHLKKFVFTDKLQLSDQICWSFS